MRFLKLILNSELLKTNLNPDRQFFLLLNVQMHAILIRSQYCFLINPLSCRISLVCA